jgi:putative drug exporter of the RND superfamily
MSAAVTESRAATKRPILERLGRYLARHAVPVLAVWAVVVAACLALALGAFGGGSLFARLTSGEPNVPGETRVGRDLLDAQRTSGEQVMLVLDGVDPADPAVRQRVVRLTADVSASAGVASVQTPFTAPGGPTGPQGRALLARDGRGVALVTELDPGLSRSAATERADALDALVRDAAADLPGATGTGGSVLQLVDEITSQVQVDLKSGEGVALPVSLLVMVLVFGGFLAAGLPLVGALVSIAGALASLFGFATLIDLDATVVNVVTILGLGLCIDYGLLVVSRFREELRAHPARMVVRRGRHREMLRTGRPSRSDVVDAVGRTVAVAGRTVLFSGLIVATSLSGLLVFEAAILRAIGAAGVSVVIVALLVALLLVPALLGLTGARLVRPGVLTRVPGLRRALTRFGDVAPATGVFSRLATLVQRRPWWVAGGVVVLLVLAALPTLGLQLRSSGTQLLPRGTDQRAFFERLDARYPALAGPDLQVVARTDLTSVQQWAASVARVPGVAAVRPPQQVGDLVVLGVTVDGGDAGGSTASRVVRELRGDRPDFPTWVVGQAAGQADYTASVGRRAPYAIGLVVAATFVLLFLMTGSVLVPIKALVLNIISLGASVGVLVLVFQDGHLQDLLGFTSTGGIESTIPPLVLAFAFGLSMDYEVFLLSRIKEHHDLGRDNDEAVVEGLQHSGRIITSAALLVVIVFAGLVAAKLLVVKQTGVALTVAVALDATLVRMLLVPATMTLLGEWNWWAPRPLRRLHRRFGLAHG